MEARGSSGPGESIEYSQEESMTKIIIMLQSVLAMIAPSLKKADSKEGVQETKEAVIGLNEVSLELAKQFKDGVQVTDFTALYAKITSDEAFKAKVLAAYEGYQKIPAEVKDIDAGEGLEIASVQLEYLPKFLDAFQSEKV
jgi:hypothetical protein